jgi:hypothetical protein
MSYAYCPGTSLRLLLLTSLLLHVGCRALTPEEEIESLMTDGCRLAASGEVSSSAIIAFGRSLGIAAVAKRDFVSNTLVSLADHGNGAKALLFAGAANGAADLKAGDLASQFYKNAIQEEIHDLGTKCLVVVVTGCAWSTMGESKLTETTIETLLPKLNGISDTQQRLAVLGRMVPLLNSLGRLSEGKRLVEASGGHWVERQHFPPPGATVIVQNGKENYTSDLSHSCQTTVSKESSQTSTGLESELNLFFMLHDKKYHEARLAASKASSPDDHLRGLTEILVQYLHDQNPTVTF